MSQNYVIPEEVDFWDAENVFYLKSPPSRIGKLLAHHDLYRRVIDRPGAIVECGVYKGASLCRFATFRHLLENDHSRQIIGLDAFGGFPTENLQSEADLAFVERFEGAGGAGITREALQRAMQAKGHVNVELIQGNVFDTVPELLERVPHLRIALLHLDLDVYEPTKFCIDRFLPHMVPGGLIVFDDYNAVEGATRAADELCRALDRRLQKLSHYNVPAFLEC